MADRPSRTEIECAYCLQPFSAPAVPGQELVCPYCGFRQLLRRINTSPPLTVFEEPPISPVGAAPTINDNGPARSSVTPPLPAAGLGGKELYSVAVPPAGLTSRPEVSGRVPSATGALRAGEALSSPAIASASPDLRLGNSEGADESSTSFARRVPRGQGRWSGPKPAQPVSVFTLVAVSIAAAIAGFAAGYWVGHYDRIALGRSHQSPRWTGSGGGKSVLVEGRITFRPDPLSGQPDAGAVVILLPATKLPEKTLPVEGLRPFESPRPDASGPKALAELGGAVERTDQSGQFMLVVPPDDYYVLLISRKTRRPKGSPIRPADLAAIRNYFYAAEDLVGQAKYHWGLYRFREGKYTVDHNFGLDEGNQPFDPLTDIQAD